MIHSTQIGSVPLTIPSLALLLTCVACDPEPDAKAASTQASQAQHASSIGEIPADLLQGSCLKSPSASTGLRYATTRRNGAMTALVRFADEQRVVVHNPSKQMLDTWFKVDGQVHFQRMFFKDGRRIDYESGDLKSLDAYGPLAGMGRFVDSSIANALGASRKVTYRCLPATARTAQIGKMQAVVVELGTGQLAAYQRTRGDLQERLRLDGFVGKSEIDTLLAQGAKLRATDYADVGDSESDPFLARAIRQGFVVLPGHADSHR